MDYGALGDVAEFFEIHKEPCVAHQATILDANDAGDIYPNLQPHKKGRVGTILELTKEIEKHIAKLNKKTKGRLGIRELAHAYEGVWNQNAREYHAPILFSYWYVQCRFIFETSFDYNTNGK